LIVIAILGILAAVIIPNVSGFITSGKIAAANSEVAAVNTAVQAYNAENPAQTTGFTFPGTMAWSTTSGLGAYLSAQPKGVYTFTITSGSAVLSSASYTNGVTLTWNSTTLQFTR